MVIFHIYVSLPEGKNIACVTSPMIQKVIYWNGWYTDTVDGRNSAPVHRFFVPLFVDRYINIYIYVYIMYICTYIYVYMYGYIYILYIIYYIYRVSTIQERAGFLPQLLLFSPADRQVLSLAPESFRDRIQWMPFKERANITTPIPPLYILVLFFFFKWMFFDGKMMVIYYTIWLWLTWPWKDPPFLIGKPSINGQWLPWLC